MRGRDREGEGPGGPGRRCPLGAAVAPRPSRGGGSGRDRRHRERPLFVPAAAGGAGGRAGLSADGEWPPPGGGWGGTAGLGRFSPTHPQLLQRVELWGFGLSSPPLCDGLGVASPPPLGAVSAPSEGRAELCPRRAAPVLGSKNKKIAPAEPAGGRLEGAAGWGVLQDGLGVWGGCSRPPALADGVVRDGACPCVSQGR